MKFQVHVQTLCQVSLLTRPVESHSPQRGPGNRCRGPITTSFRRRRDRDAESVESVEREEMLGGVSPHHPTMGLGERRKLLQRGRGGAPAENGFYAYFRCRKLYKPSGTPFAVFLSDGGAPERCGARENFPPSPLDGPAVNFSEVKFKVRGQNRPT